MNMKESEVLIKLNGKVHRINKANPASITKMDWEDRKQLIDLLENIKQAEYVKEVESSEDIKSSSSISLDLLEKKQSDVMKTKQENVQQRGIQTPQNTSQLGTQKLDPEIKASEKDVDDIMARLILEQNQSNTHQPVPEKSVVIKLLFIVFAIIIALAMIF